MPSQFAPTALQFVAKGAPAAENAGTIRGAACSQSARLARCRGPRQAGRKHGFIHPMHSQPGGAHEVEPQPATGQTQPEDAP